MLFVTAEATFINAASYDLALTVAGLRHPPILHLAVEDNGLARSLNLDESQYFAEGGWARVFGAHNIPAILTAYAAEDLAVYWLVHHFVARHPRWRVLGTLVLFEQAFMHVRAGSTWVGLGDRVAAPYEQFDPVWIH